MKLVHTRLLSNSARFLLLIQQVIMMYNKQPAFAGGSMLRLIRRGLRRPPETAPPRAGETVRHPSARPVGRSLTRPASPARSATVVLALVSNVGQTLTVAALALAALLTLPAQAQAQVWSSTLTVGTHSGVVGCSNGLSAMRCRHNLTEDNFTYDGIDYTVKLLWIQSGALTLELSNSATPTAAGKKLTLNVAGTSFAFADVDAPVFETTGSRLDWANSGLSWSSGNTIALTLTAPAPNNPPTVATAIQNQTATAGTEFRYTVSSSAFTDADGDALTYTATKGDGNALPGWLSFATSSRAFSGTPLSADTVAVKVTASDGNGGSVSDTFNIVVGAANNPPTVATEIPNQTATAATLFSYTVSSSAFTDADGDALTYTAAKGDGNALPGWLSFATSSRVFSGTPPSASMVAIKVTASDGNGGSVSDTFNIVVGAANNPPTVATEIPNQTATAATLFSYTVSSSAFTDADGDALTYTAAKGDGNALPGWLSFATSSRAFSGTPPRADTVAVKVTASDSSGGSVSDTFNIVVGAAAPTNTAPTVATEIPNQTATAATLFSYTVSSSAFNDADSGDTLTYTAAKGDASALPGWLSFAASSRVFSGTPPSADTVAVKVTASDGNGGSVSDTFDIVVSAANNPPTVATEIPNQTATAATLFSYTVSSSAFTDADGDTLTYTAAKGDDSALPGWLSFATSSRVFSGTPLSADTVAVKVTASDSSGGSVSDTFDIVVSAANNPPTVATEIPNQTATAATLFSYTVPADAFNDADGDTLTYTATKGDGTTLPSWLTFTPGSRAFSGTPLSASTVAVKVTASDSGGSVSDTFNIVVGAAAPTNTAPTVATEIPNQTATAATLFSYTVSSSAFTDADGDTLTYTATKGDASALPGWLSFATSSRVFSGTPLSADTVAVKVTASDSSGGSVSDTFNIVVSAANNPPTVATEIPNQTATAGTEFSYTVSSSAFTDADGDALTYTAAKGDGNALPGWLSFATSSRVFSGTPLSADTVAVKVTASDSSGGSVSDTFNIVVGAAAPTNTAPTVMTAIPNQTATAGTEFTYTVPADAFNDADSGDTLTYTAAKGDASALPNWLSFAASSRVFSGTPPSASMVAIKVTASDGNGGSVSDTFDIVVSAANNPPTVANAIPNQTATAGRTFSYTVSSSAFSDADGDTLTYTAAKGDGTTLPSWLTFTPGSRAFSGTPLSASTVAVKVTASDSGGSVSDTFDIVVSAPTVVTALPAWLARFGRTVTDPVLEAVTDRLAAPRSPGMKVSLAGRALPIRGQDNAVREDLPHGAPGVGSRALQSWSPTGRDLTFGTSFSLTGEPRADGALLSVWGRGVMTNFAGRDGGLALDGEAQTLLVGAERSWRGWTTGGVLGRSRAEGGYRSATETGEIEATLTGVYPWVGRAVNDQVSAWAALGYGAGDLTFQPEDGDPIRADLSLALGAAGLRGEVLRPLEAGGLSLAVKGDVRFTHAASKAAGDTMVGRLMAAEADVWRVRAGVEGARSFMANDGAWGTVTPSFEVGVRLDGGDAETGFGADVGGGVALVDPGRGVRLEMKARGLAAHEDEGLREWGASAALDWEPRPQSGRGLSLSLTQSWGASSSGGMDALLARDTLVGLAASDTAPAGRRLEAELGYGMAAFGGDFTGVPNAGLALTEGGRDWRLGWRLTPAWPDSWDFEVNLDVLRNEADGEAPEHAVMLRSACRF